MPYVADEHLFPIRPVNTTGSITRRLGRRQAEVNMSALWAETDEPLYNAMLFSGSTSDEANIKFKIFFHRRHKITLLHVSDSGKGRWRCGARRSYSEIRKSFIVTDTMHTTPCGTQRRDTFGTNTICYQKYSVFTSLYEYWLSQMMVL